MQSACSADSSQVSSTFRPHPHIPSSPYQFLLRITCPLEAIANNSDERKLSCRPGSVVPVIIEA